jgi:hypothetical protein
MLEKRNKHLTGVINRFGAFDNYEAEFPPMEQIPNKPFMNEQIAVKNPSEEIQQEYQYNQNVNLNID